VGSFVHNPYCLSPQLSATLFMKIRNTLAAMALSLLSLHATAQSEIHPFAGIGYGMENRIGFRGANLSGGIAIPFHQHISAIAQADLFHGQKVAGWNATMNQGARYTQVMASIRMQYGSGEEPGTGFLAQAGLAIQGGSTYHFDYGNVHDGGVTDAHYATEKIRGSGFVLGIGYGFKLGENLAARLMVTDQAILRVNDMYTVGFSLMF
jgi:hypothetical protein